MWTVTDLKTGNEMGRYDTSAKAYRRADRLDRAYGAVRYVVRFVEVR